MEIEGIIKTIVYRNEDNGYTVLELVDDSGDEIVVVGSMPLASVGEKIIAEGDYVEHRAYGLQFRAQSSRTKAPATLSALISYLSCGLIKGVGEATAQNIVATFGMETLDILENDPMRLSEVPGIGPARARTIAASFMLRRDMRDVMLALSEYGVSVAQAMKLYKIYGAMCLAKLKENPYRLVEDVEGIGFKTADNLAQNLGIEKDSPYRLRAGIKYTLSWAMHEGHTCLPYDKLVEVAAEILGAEILPVEKTIDDMVMSRELSNKVIDGEPCIALHVMDHMERECAKFLSLLNRPPVQSPFYSIEDGINSLEKEFNIELAPSQREAVLSALTNGVMVITGGPGTGKTTILKFIIRLFDKIGIECELCAPTGRAAKRMSEAAGREARTIHRMLELGYGKEEFMRNSENTLDADAIIVDEASMVDIRLMHALLRALNMGTRLIMVGDADQLPPVGAGNVLHDMIKSSVIPVTRLTDIFRQSERSAIVTNAHRINMGKSLELSGKSPDFIFEEIQNVDMAVKRIVALCMGKTNKLLTDDTLKDVQVLSPMKKGETGVNNLNAKLQQALNPPERKKRERKYSDVVFREGDKVMQTKNNYRIEWKKICRGRDSEYGEGVYNGDMGTIMRIDNDAQTMQVLFDDERLATYEFSMLDELSLAYCVSVHKSQGSEFPIVILPLLGGPPMLMTRNLLYTAVTRARAQVYIIGREYCVKNMINNTNVKKRYSVMADYLKYGY
ncbi:MAG: ATP-dependent RecD-like DNA helicase [Clostridia bacterium]|nr:ATP-dependent RecD-like DNA helicase [Clostridia bacterium]